MVVMGKRITPTAQIPKRSKKTLKKDWTTNSKKKFQSIAAIAVRVIA
jgi:hypothetical protein